MGSLWDVLGGFGCVFGRFWGAYGALLGVNNVKKSTFRTYAFYVRKTTYFVGLGGQVGAKMAPRRANMRQHGPKFAKVLHRKAKDGAKRPRTQPRWFKIAPRIRI